MENHPEIIIHLEDNEWPFEFTDHDRQIARAIVVDDFGYFYFVRVERNDDFGRATLIETSGGGVEDGEELHPAILRELKEELGVEAEIICEIGVVDADSRFVEICDTLSIGASIENMLLTATEIGLGTLWIANTCYAYKELTEYLETTQQLVGAIALGYADEKPIQRPRKQLEDIVEYRL